MNRLSKIAGILLLLTLVAGAAWALADSKSVNFLFEAAWEVDETLPGGGVIVSRGEGSNGVITVDLPMPPPTEAVEPPINYLARDYTSFRTLMLDRMAVTMPDWQERNPADIGITVVEALAHAADHLSYYQDAVATEAYLGTSRRRASPASC